MTCHYGGPGKLGCYNAPLSVVKVIDRMSEHIRYLIRILAVVFIVYGAIELLQGLKPVWWTLQCLFYSSQNTRLEHLYFDTLTFFFQLMLPVAAIFAGIGLFKVRKWGRILSLTVSLIIFAFSFASTIEFAIAIYVLRNVPVPPIPEGVVVHRVSMIPTWITAFVSLTFCWLLSRDSVKRNLRY